MTNTIQQAIFRQKEKSASGRSSDRWERVIEELTALSQLTNDPNLKACAEMTAGDLQHFLQNPTSSGLPSMDLALFNAQRAKSYERKDDLHTWLEFKKEVEEQLYQGLHYFDEHSTVRGCLHRIHLEVNRVKNLLRMEF